MAVSRIRLSLGWLALAGAALAGDPLSPAKLPGESLSAARRLAEAGKLADKQKWMEAVEEYQRILEEVGDELVPLDPQKRGHCVQVRRVCAMQLARHPPLLRLYRARVDDRAKKWLDQGIADRDPVWLRRLVDRAFASRHTDRALELLGDLAFERGDFAEAESWWRLLALPVSRATDRTDFVFVYPDPRTEIALIRAKLILSQIFRGDHGGALVELSAFRAAHGKAEGHVAGRKGNLAAILQEAAGHADRLAAPAAERGWPTWAGADSRTAVAPKAPRCRWLEQPWRVRLDGEGPAAPVQLRTATQQAQACVFQPVIAGDLVLVADDRSVTAFDLFTGRRRGRWELAEERPSRWPLKAAQEHGVRYTLTVAGNRVYVRLGTPIPRPAQGEILKIVPVPRPGKDDAAKNTPTDSYLVCLALPPDRDGKLTACWQVKARTPDMDIAFFEGSPLVHDDWAYVGHTRITADGRAMTAIDCYRADTGTRHWRQDICAAQEAGDGNPRYRYQLLTRAGPNVVYCSHSGAIVAVDAATGQRAWAVRYPRRGNRPANSTLSPRDLAPAVYADGRLFIAPADLDHIVCLDAATGCTLWESNALEVGHLLGVAKGRLIFTTASFPAGIRAVEAATGRDLRGWLQPSGDSNGLPTVGRGLLAGDWVYWPTVNGLRILTQEDGEPAADAFLPLKNSIQGNLAAAEGCLVAATDRELLGYVPESKSLGLRQKDAQTDPADAMKHFRLGRALVSADLPEAALAEFEQADKLADTPEMRRQARQERHAALLLAAKNGHAEKAAAALRQAAAPDFPVSLRLVALARLAEIQTQERKPRDAVATWQTILGDDDLRSASWTNPAGFSQSAAELAFQKINALIAAHGPGVYAKAEAQAKALPIEGHGSRAAVAQFRLFAEFPNSSIAPTMLLRQALQSKLAGNQTQTARLCRRLLEWPIARPERAQALTTLARHYERQRHFEGAIATWKRLAREHSEQKVAILNPAGTVQEFAAAELRRLEQRAVAADLPDLGLPLKQIWRVSISAKKKERLLSAQVERFYLVREDVTLICRDANTGKECWRAPNKLETCTLRSPTWIAAHADLAVAAGPQRIVVLTEGSYLWSFDPDASMGRLDSFQLVGSRLFCLQGQRRLWALDLETGTVLWALWAPGAQVGVSPPHGCFHSFALAGPDRMVIQPSHGRAWIVDAQTGRKLHDLDAAGDPWPQPAVMLDDRRACLQPDPRQLVLVDVSTGKEIWRHTVERPVSLTGEPLQVAAAGDSLLAIVSRSQGHELIRLDPATGKPQWGQALFLGVDRPELAHGAWDREAVYLPVAGTLHAISLRSSKRLWSCPLGTGGWQVRRTRNYLLVHQREADAEMPFGPALRRYLPGAPTVLYPASGSVVAGLPGVLTVLSRMQSPSRFSAVICNPRDGRVLQRLNLVSRGLPVAVSLGERGAVIGLAGAICGLR